MGTNPYAVHVDAQKFDHGDCDCYLGQNEYLCKHMIAVAIYAIRHGKPLNDDDIKQHNDLEFSNKLGELSETKLDEMRASISEAIKFIKAYSGPSRIWFSYQASLTEGCNRLAAIFSELPASKQTTDIIIKTLLRLDKKLRTGGVDDSDGEVGGFIERSVEILMQFATKDKRCLESFKVLRSADTCFGWEDELLRLIE